MSQDAFLEKVIALPFNQHTEEMFIALWREFASDIAPLYPKVASLKLETSHYAEILRYLSLKATAHKDLHAKARFIMEDTIPELYSNNYGEGVLSLRLAFQSWDDPNSVYIHLQKYLNVEGTAKPPRLGWYFQPNSRDIEFSLDPFFFFPWSDEDQFTIQEYAFVLYKIMSKALNRYLVIEPTLLAVAELSNLNPNVNFADAIVNWSEEISDINNSGMFDEYLKEAKRIPLKFRTEEEHRLKSEYTISWAAARNFTTQSSLLENEVRNLYRNHGLYDALHLWIRTDITSSNDLVAQIPKMMKILSANKILYNGSKGYYPHVEGVLKGALQAKART